MRTIFSLFLIVLSFLLQSSLPGYLRIQGVIPNLLLVIFVLIIMVGDYREIFSAALAGGLLMDIFSPFPFGTFILTFAALGFVFSKAKYYLFTKANFMIFLLKVFLATVFYYLFAVAMVEIMYLIKMPVFNFSAKNILFITLPREILFNLAAAVAIYGLFKIKKTPFVKLTRSHGFRSNF